MSQRPEFSDHTRKPETPHERGDHHQQNYFSHSDYQHVSQSRNGQAKQDTHHEVQKGHLPGLDLTNDQNHNTQHHSDRHHGAAQHHSEHHHAQHHIAAHHDATHGKKNDGTHRDTSRGDVNSHDGTRADGTRPDAIRPDGTRPDATRPDGTRPGGTRTDAAAGTTPNQLDKTHPQQTASKNEAGVVNFNGLHGAAVDTDGSAAKNHKEDRSRQNQTSLTDGHGHSLDADKVPYVALPKEEMKAKGIKVGDHGYLQRADTGEKVPVVFGDVSGADKFKHGKGEIEASPAALKALGFNNVNGKRGVDKSVPFNLAMAQNSRNSSDFDIASR